MLACSSVFSIVGIDNTDQAPYVVASLIVNPPYSIAEFVPLSTTIPEGIMAIMIVSLLMDYLQIIDMIPRPAMHSPP